MAMTFAITTAATETVKADSGGHAQAMFTVTNTTGRPVRGIARPQAIGDTKQEWLSITGDTERDISGGATETVTVKFDAVGAPAGKYPFRLDVSSAKNPDEDFTEGPTVNVEVAAAAPPPPPKPGFPKWIIFAIIGAVLLIGGIILLVVLLSGDKTDDEEETPTPTPVESPSPSPTPTPEPSPSPSPTSESAAVIEKRCFDLVQGQIAWNYNNDRSWAENNIQNLCRGTSEAAQPPRCFQRVMHGGISTGSGLTVERNIDRPGRDYNNFNLPRPQFELCRDACASDVRCSGYTYVNPNVQGPSARCWLKTGALPATVPNGCCTSGVKTGSGGTQWQWPDALELCKGTNDSDRVISCYQAAISRGASMQEAINACKGR